MNNTLILTLLSILPSALSILWLRHVNPKRRRALNYPTYKKPTYQLFAWLLLLLPGLILITISKSAAFVIWLGAVPLLGWLLALIHHKPEIEIHTNKNPTI